MRVSDLEDQLGRGATIFRNGSGWMVSLRSKLGFRTFYGDALEETMTRALANGPQVLPGSEPEPDDSGDDWMDLI